MDPSSPTPNFFWHFPGRPTFFFTLKLWVLLLLGTQESSCSFSQYQFGLLSWFSFVFALVVLVINDVMFSGGASLVYFFFSPYCTPRFIL